MSNEIKVGKISESHAVGVGVRVKITSPASGVESLNATQALQEFIELLSVHAGRVHEVEKVQRNAERAKEEVGARRPNKEKLRRLLQKITLGVAGVTELADSVEKVRSALHI